MKNASFGMTRPFLLDFTSLLDLLLYSTYTEKPDCATNAPCCAVIRTSHCPGSGETRTNIGMEPSACCFDMSRGLGATSRPSRNTCNVAFRSSVLPAAGAAPDCAGYTTK